MLFDLPVDAANELRNLAFKQHFAGGYKALIKTDVGGRCESKVETRPKSRILATKLQPMPNCRQTLILQMIVASKVIEWVCSLQFFPQALDRSAMRKVPDSKSIASIPRDIASIPRSA